MALESGERLASHVSRERGDASIGNPRPFRMRARQNESSARQSARGERPKNLSLLASHHVGRLRTIDRAHARREGDVAELLRPDRRHRRADFLQAGGAVRIGGFDPSLARANHAGHQNRRRVASKPFPDQALKHVLMVAWRNRENAAIQFHALQHGPVARHQIGAQRTGAPIDANRNRRASRHVPPQCKTRLRAKFSFLDRRCDKMKTHEIARWRLAGAAAGRRLIWPGTEPNPCATGLRPQMPARTRSEFGNRPRSDHSPRAPHPCRPPRR